MYIKIGSKESAIVKEIQFVVGVTSDGVFGLNTKRAVSTWQRRHMLTPDGIVGPQTFEAMELLDSDSFTPIIGEVENYYMPSNEYLHGPYENEYIFLHHTAGHSNPYHTIDSWAKDSRGRVGTEFVIGGQGVKGVITKYDGKVLRAFPEGGAAYSLGRTGSQEMNKHSVGIELNSMGYIEDGKTYVGGYIHPDQICTLKEPFKGFTQWHKYSDAQLVAAKTTLLYIGERDNIDLHEGLYKWIKTVGPTKAFGFNEDAWGGKIKGLLTHTNVRKGKYDCFPQPELIDMLLTL